MEAGDILALALHWIERFEHEKCYSLQIKKMFLSEKLTATQSELSLGSDLINFEAESPVQ